jgi:hypothetical protein
LNFIENETENSKSGQKKAQIINKVNALTESQLIDACTERLKRSNRFDYPFNLLAYAHK